MVRLVAVLFAVAGGWAGWQYLHAEDGLDVHTVRLCNGPLAMSVTATGKLAPTTEVFVGCEVSGTVESLLAHHNDAVKRGQVIARLKPELYQAEHDQAVAELARVKAQLEQLQVQARETQREYDRVTKLHQEQAASEEEVHVRRAATDEARANVEAGTAAVQSAQSRVELTRYHLDRTTITSPIDGIVLDRKVDVGQTIAATLQTPVLFVLAEDLSRMDLLADVSEADVGFICPGQEATFTVNAYRDRTFKGRVRQIRNQPSSVGNVVTYTVVITVANPDYLLRPGMPADVNIEIVRRDQTVKVANAALRFRPPLPPDEIRRILDGVEWPPPPAPIEVATSRPATSGPAEISIRPPPVEPTRATLWQYAGGQWRPIPVWATFTDNRETALAGGAGIESGAAFVVEARKTESSQSTFQKAIMLARPENRKL
jgi:HlyD family secretion protein